MAHPMVGEAKRSLKARLRRLGVSAGKPHGASNMYKKKSLPKKNAGRDVGFTIEGAKARSRADRSSQRYANGGAVSGGAKRKGHHTTNIVISAPGGRAGIGAGRPGGAGMPAVVQHVHRHVAGPGVPLGGLNRPLGAPPVGPVGAGAPLGVRPPMGAPIAARPPIVAGGPPIAGAGVAPPGMPPGMKTGGFVGKAPGKAYAGYPHSPTTEVKSAVSSRKKGGNAYANGGDVSTLNKSDEDETEEAAPPGRRRGGHVAKSKKSHVKKRQFGGPMAGAGAAPQQQPGLLGMPMPGRAPTPAQPGPPTLSGRPARPAQPLTVPMPPMLTSMRARPAPGTTTGYKRGGSKVHSDEAEDKRLFKRMYKEEEAKETKKEEKKRKRGGIAPSIEGGHSVLRAVPPDQKIEGSVPKKSVPKGHASVLAGEKYKSWGVGKRKRGGATGGNAGDSIQQAAPTRLAGENYKSWGVGFRARGGGIGSSHGSPQAPYGSGSGLGRLRKEKSAAKVPDKTEL